MKTLLDKTEIARWKKIAQQDFDYHQRQFAKPYRSTSYLGEFIRSLIGPTQGEALDIACGAGANIFHLSQMIPGFHWSGVDIAGEVLFPIGSPFFNSKGLELDLKAGDFYKLEDYFGGKKFDLVLAIHTFSSLESYDALLDQLLSVTRGWLFATSMFTDFNVDVNIEVKDYTWPEDCPNPGNYNVYSLSRFRKACEAKGCKQFVSRDFVIDVDLPPPENGGLGTYTRKLEDGQRLQFSGPIFLPWKVVGVRMGDSPATSARGKLPGLQIVRLEKRHPAR
ncbi:MAG: class I SAM-dependent methyltransferase [Terriglobales bacterium]|jgi:SAM-dependent methyltransferase